MSRPSYPTSLADLKEFGKQLLPNYDEGVKKANETILID